MNIQFNKFPPLVKALVAVLVVAPIMLHSYYVFRYAINAPHMDDFDAVLNFLNKYDKATGIDKAALLFSQHNEHRIFFSRAVYALYHSIFGLVNFRNLIIIDGAILMAMFLVLMQFMRRLLPAAWQLAVLPLSICLFSINGYENSDFAMAGMQNYGVILLFVTSMLCYSSASKVMLLPAALCQAVCVFSSGNGNVGSFFILLFAIGLREKPKVWVATLVFFLAGPLYYYQYKQPATNFFTADPTKFIPFFFHAAGAYFGFYAGLIAGAIVVALTLVLLPLQKKVRISREALPFLCILGFILASLGVMSMFRGNLPVQGSYASRYFIYSNLLCAMVVIFLIAKPFSQQFQLRAIPASIIILLVFGWYNFNIGDAGFKEYNAAGLAHPYDYPDYLRAKNTVDESCRLGIYCLDTARFPHQ